MTQRRRKSFIREDAGEDAAVFGAADAPATRAPEAEEGPDAPKRAERTHRVTVIFDDATFKALKRYVIDRDDVGSMSELIRAQIASLVAASDR